jgi:glutathione S-transferase
MRDAFWQLVRTPADSRDEAVLRASLDNSERRATVLDAHLARHRWLSGEGFTLADLVNGCAAHRWLQLPAVRTPRPHIERWYAELKSRRASRQVTSLPLS